MLFICFGIPKSASTFVYQLVEYAVRNACEVNGRKFSTLRQLNDRYPEHDFVEDVLKDRSDCSEENRLEHLSLFVNDLLRDHDELRHIDLVVKTHLPCSPIIGEMIERGSLNAVVTFRHPAEMILSRLDMAHRDGETFSHTGLVRAYETCINDFFTWVSHSPVLAIYYSQLVIQPHLIAQRIAEHVNYCGDIESYINYLLENKRNTIGQFNAGRAFRAKDELGNDDILSIERKFPAFIEYISQNVPSELTGILSESNPTPICSAT
jgi:hypothetical protein